MPETPQKDEWWSVTGGGGQGRKLKIIDIPDTVPAEENYAVVQLVGEERTRNVPLDDRWGTTITRVSEDPTDNERRDLTRQSALDRVVRVGMGHYGLEDPAEIVTKLLTDYCTWGDGAPVEHLVERAREVAREKLA